MSIISIHVPARGTTRVHCHTGRGLYISIHVPARGTDSTGPLSHRPRPVYFNPRTRTGYDSFPAVISQMDPHFNPRTRTGYDFTGGVKQAGTQFQSTYPHGVRLEKQPARSPVRIISIHVPARGTTRRRDNPPAYYCISIHVPARGTTCFGLGKIYMIVISIHVPARGTTQDLQAAYTQYGISIHVPARGTTWSYGSGHPGYKFQSTYPHGVRLRRWALTARSTYFNPRTRTGYDARSPLPGHPPRNFNPRTRTGYDAGPYRCGPVSWISIHVPARGTTRCVRYDLPCQLISIHVPARGTTDSADAVVVSWEFQSTYPHGVRRLSKDSLKRQ